MIVILDSSFLLSFFHPGINSSEPDNVENCQRITELIKTLSSNGTKIGIPTPVLSEILVGSGPDKQRILEAINNTRFKILLFNQAAAVEVAHLTDRDLQSNKRIVPPETKVKVKYDRQIIAIAKVNGIETIYANDNGLRNTAIANKIEVISIIELPLPKGQTSLQLTVPPGPIIGDVPKEGAMSNGTAAEPFQLAAAQLQANSTLAKNVIKESFEGF